MCVSEIIKIRIPAGADALSNIGHGKRGGSRPFFVEALLGLAEILLDDDAVGLSVGEGFTPPVKPKKDIIEGSFVLLKFTIILCELPVPVRSMAHLS